MVKAERYKEGLEEIFVRSVVDNLPFMSFKYAQDFYAQSNVPGFSGSKAEAFLAANDRFYLLTVVLKRHDAQHEWIYDRCREVEEAPDEHLDLWARYHYKSTLITFAGSIQEIIHDPEITIAIFGNTFDVAQPFLEQITRELEENEHLKALYPDVFWTNPRKEAPTWSKDRGIVVKRASNPKELTVQAFGIMEALPTGGHWRLRIYDDMVTLKSVTETDTNQIGKTTIRWEMSQNLGTHEGGRRWVVGTRYNYADAYSTMLERRSLTPRIYPATKDGTLNGKPVFLSQTEWERIKRDQRSVVASQMLLNPVAGKEATFFVDHLRSYDVRPRAMNVYILGDPAGKPRQKSDRTALAVVGIDSALNRYLLDGYCHKMRMSERWENLKNLFVKWNSAPGVQMVRIGYEKYGMQSDEEYFEEKIYQQKIEGMTVDSVAWVREGPQSKTARIGRLEPYFRNSQFYLPPKVWHPDYGLCTWQVTKRTEAMLVNDQPVTDPKTGATIMVDIEGSADIAYLPYKAPTRMEIAVKAKGEHFRIMEPIRRIDQDGTPYDLTRVLMEEYRLHPFAPKDDFIDALSRIQDVDPTAPLSEGQLLEIESLPLYLDS